MVRGDESAFPVAGFPNPDQGAKAPDGSPGVPVESKPGLSKREYIAIHGAFDTKIDDLGTADLESLGYPASPTLGNAIDWEQWRMNLWAKKRLRQVDALLEELASSEVATAAASQQPSTT